MDERAALQSKEGSRFLKPSLRDGHQWEGAKVAATVEVREQKLIWRTTNSIVDSCIEMGACWVLRNHGRARRVGVMAFQVKVLGYLNCSWVGLGGVVIHHCRISILAGR